MNGEIQTLAYPKAALCSLAMAFATIVFWQILELF